MDTDHMEQAQQKAILDGLGDLRKKKSMTDVTLKTKDGEIEAHSILLSVNSPYFKSILDGKEKAPPTEIDISEIKTDTMQNVLDYMYSGKVPSDVKEDTSKAQDLIEALDILEMPELKDYSWDALVNNVEADNFVEPLNFAESKNNEKAENDIYNFVKDNFDDVADKPDILELSPSQMKKVMERVKDDQPSDKMMETILKWAKHDPENRKPELNSLLETVNFDELSDEMLRDLPTNEPMVKESLELLQKLLSTATSRLEGKKPRSPHGSAPGSRPNSPDQLSKSSKKSKKSGRSSPTEKAPIGSPPGSSSPPATPKTASPSGSQNEKSKSNPPSKSPHPDDVSMSTAATEPSKSTRSRSRSPSEASSGQYSKTNTYDSSTYDYSSKGYEIRSKPPTNGNKEKENSYDTSSKSYETKSRSSSPQRSQSPTSLAPKSPQRSPSPNSMMSKSPVQMQKVKMCCEPCPAPSDEILIHKLHFFRFCCDFVARAKIQTYIPFKREWCDERFLPDVVSPDFIVCSIGCCLYFLSPLYQCVILYYPTNGRYKQLTATCPIGNCVRVVENCNKIYVWSEDAFLRFNPGVKRWESLASRKGKFADCYFMSTSNFLFLRDCHNAILYAYNSTSNQWHLQTKNPIINCSSSCAPFQGKLYFVNGGEMSVYDPENNQWEEMQLPEEINRNWTHLNVSQEWPFLLFQDEDESLWQYNPSSGELEQFEEPRNKNISDWNRCVMTVEIHKVNDKNIC